MRRLHIVQPQPKVASGNCNVAPLISMANENNNQEQRQLQAGFQLSLKRTPAGQRCPFQGPMLQQSYTSLA